MALTGKQKAAMLLMSLDTLTAAELLKGLNPDEIQEIAIEIARIEASRQHDVNEQSKIIQEFCSTLRQEQMPKFSVRTFLNEMLVNILDKEKAEHIQSQVKKATEQKDLFSEIRSADVNTLVLALDGEHPQTIAVILSELPPNKSQEVLSRLSDDVRLKIVRKMTNPEPMGSGIKQRMASTIIKRLKSFQGEDHVEKPEQALRKLAVVLSGMEKEMRDPLLEEIAKDDQERAALVKRLMVTWEDIRFVADRSMQEALRSIDTGKLALALYGAEEDIVQKIRSNMSERAVSMLEDEISLMKEPVEKDILEAREKVIEPLRQANDEGTLKLTRL